jgi:predicted dehydrogenase
VPAGDAYLLELEDFAAAVAGQREQLLGRADAVGQARALEALQTAAVQRTEVSPPFI